MKTILAVWNKAEKGKTESIREFAKQLLTSYPSFTEIYPIPMTIHPKWDFRIVVKINGKIIGIESQGDPNTGLEERLSELVNVYKCDVIICSTRTSGSTVYAVQNISTTYGYNDIWTSTYEIQGKTQQSFVNNLKGKHILDLLQSLKVI